MSETFIPGPQPREPFYLLKAWTDDTAEKAVEVIDLDDPTEDDLDDVDGDVDVRAFPADAYAPDVIEWIDNNAAIFLTEEQYNRWLALPF